MARFLAATGDDAHHLVGGAQFDLTLHQIDGLLVGVALAEHVAAGLGVLHLALAGQVSLVLRLEPAQGRELLDEFAVERSGCHMLLFSPSLLQQLIVLTRKSLPREPGKAILPYPCHGPD